MTWAWQAGGGGGVRGTLDYSDLQGVGNRCPHSPIMLLSMSDLLSPFLLILIPPCTPFVSVCLSL